MEQLVQLRSEETGIQFTDSLEEAFEIAKKDKTIWKISIQVGEERLRLVAKYGNWVVEQMEDEIAKLAKNKDK